MKAVFDVLRIFSTALVSCIVKPGRSPFRSWGAELTFRLARRMLAEANSKTYSWMRERQKKLKMLGPELFKVHTHSMDIAGVPCLEFVPKNSNENEMDILYFHGGGYVLGSAEGYSLTTAKLALASGAKVISVDYRLCPEHPLPTAHKDCLRVAQSLSGKGRTLILAGDSAGGALAVATCLAMKKGGVDACILISPWVAPLHPETLVDAHDGTDFLTKAVVNRWAKDASAGGEQVSHLLDFTDVDLSGLAPTYIQSAGWEIFSAQIDEFAQRLEDSGVSVLHDVYPQQFHVFQTLAPLVFEADEAIKRMGTFAHSQCTRQGSESLLVS